jgi:class 3 adenylate cyclase
LALSRVRPTSRRATQAPGVVFLQRDINDYPNVTGPGINLAERVMRCGEEGHILVSGEAAELLRHLSAWSDKLEYLGEYRAKRDAVRIWNFLDGDIGNPAPLKAARRAAQAS